MGTLRREIFYRSLERRRLLLIGVHVVARASIFQSKAFPIHRVDFIYWRISSSALTAI